MAATVLPTEVPTSTDGSELGVSIQTLNDERLAMVLDGVELALANALRRTMIANIPTLGTAAMPVPGGPYGLP
jgi:DNA-directed RNA polymerase II subunit RPB3